jgi:hypothetical protein
MKKLFIVMGLAIVTAVSASANTAYLLVHDDNGNSTVLMSSGTGTITFNGVIGDWSLNVTTGLANPPFGANSVTGPSIDLNSINAYAGTGGKGSHLTILFFADGLGPIVNGGYTHQSGGTITPDTSITDQFHVNKGASTVDGTGGVNLNTQTASSSPFALSSGLLLNIPVNSTLGIEADLFASGAGLTSFDSNLSPVPDAGMTLALLGSALTGLALFARNRKTA